MGEEADVKTSAKRGQDGPFKFGTGLVNQLIVDVATGFVLDVEDTHFNTDRSVILPDLKNLPGVPPSVDERRITGLGVLFAALVHAGKHSEQRLFVTGHTDPSGTAAHNQSLSEKRAENVSLLLRGERDKWRKHSNKTDNVDDVQTILKWQNDRAGWNCDPGEINGKLNGATRRAVRSFQEKYNTEVDAAQGKDTPFKKKIGVDGDVGVETWGAFYDVYMSELMELLEFDAFSALEERQKKLKAPDGIPDFVGCGEHVPFDPALRNNPEDGKEERTEGLQRDRSDRRVELLFFDPGEQVKLDCHPKKGQCKPQLCPIYKKHEFTFDPIEIPEGLDIAEMNLVLTFADPEGKVRPFPEGLEVELMFGDPKDFPPEEQESEDFHTDPLLSRDDFDLEDPNAPPEGEGEEATGSESEAAEESDEGIRPGPDGEDFLDREPNVVTAKGGRLRFVIPRKARTCFLRFLGGERRFISGDPVKLDDQKLVNKEEATAAALAGRVVLALPPEFNTLDGFWNVPDDVQFADGMFQDIDAKSTKIGTREEPAELKLDVQWQFFRFEYFDRWTNSPAVVPGNVGKGKSGTRTPSAIFLVGHEDVLDSSAFSITSPRFAQCAWSVGTGKDVVHCLGWVRRAPDADDDAKLRDVPDAKCTIRAVTQGVTYVRTEGDGKSGDAERLLIDDVGPHEGNEYGAERLRLYDLPGDWWSTKYPVHFPGEALDETKPFEEAVGTKSSKGKPYVVPLDLIVIANGNGVGPETDDVHPDRDMPWDDAIENRFAIYDSELNVYKPHAKEKYFTDLGRLSKKPDRALLFDFPPFTRLIARGRHLYEVFDDRTSHLGFKGFPIGARQAKRITDTVFSAHFARVQFPYDAPRPRGTSDDPAPLGYSAVVLLRCCGRDGNVELFRVFQYLTLVFDFSPPPNNDEGGKAGSPPSDEVGAVADCLVAVANRWNGPDSVNASPIAFHVGKPEVARGTWKGVFARGAPSGPNKAMYRVSIFEKGFRAWTSPYPPEPHAQWANDDLEKRASEWFTAAHELGHAMSLPDEYLNRDYEPSLEQPNIGEDYRSPGVPYGLDGSAMMNENIDIRVRNFWHLVEWFQSAEIGGKASFPDVKDVSITRGPRTFTTEVVGRTRNRVQYAVTKPENTHVGKLGFCDRFLFLTGHDEWTAGGLRGSSIVDPFDGFIMIRVKLALQFASIKGFDDMRALASRAFFAIQRAYNTKRGVALRGTADGRKVHLRVLFAPRFLGLTFPEESDEAKKYLESCHPKLTTAKLFGDHVEEQLKAPGVHADVVIQDGGSSGGVTQPTEPRKGVIRHDTGFLSIFTSDKFEDDVVKLFSQLIGLEEVKPPSPDAFRPLAEGLPPLENPKMEFVN